jgi:hypothetical protein
MTAQRTARGSSRALTLHVHIRGEPGKETEWLAEEGERSRSRVGEQQKSSVGEHHGVNEKKFHEPQRRQKTGQGQELCWVGPSKRRGSRSRGRVVRLRMEEHSTAKSIRGFPTHTSRPRKMHRQRTG